MKKAFLSIFSLLARYKSDMEFVLSGDFYRWLEPSESGCLFGDGVEQKGS
jgi:hypothetical protein